MKFDHRILGDLDWEAEKEFASVMGPRGNKRLSVLTNVKTKAVRYSVTTNGATEFFAEIDDAVSSYNDPL